MQYDHVIEQIKLSQALHFVTTEKLLFKSSECCILQTRRNYYEKNTFFVTLEKVQEITGKYPTPFHLYDEKGIRENAQALKEAFCMEQRL